VSDEESPFGEGVKTIRSHSQFPKPVYLTDTEKDEITMKYTNGTPMSVLAREYGCHRTTVSKVLRENGATIRCGFCN